MLFFSLHAARADSVTVHGVAFSADVLRPTGAGYTAVGIGSRHELVEDKDVGAFIVAAYFSDRELFRTLDEKDVARFVSEGASSGDLDGVKEALRALCEFGDATSESAISLFDELSAAPAAIEVFKYLLSAVSLESVSPKIISICLYTVGKSDPDWVRSNAARLFYTTSDALRAHIREHILESLRADTLDRAEQDAALLKTLFGVDDPEAKSFEALVVKIRELSRQGAGIELTLSELTENDPVLRRYLTPLFMETVHAKAQDLLKKGEPEKSLQILSHVEQDKRTPLTHSLTAESVRALSPSSSVFLTAPNVEPFVAKVAEKDASVKEAYFEAIEAMLADRVSKGLLSEGEEILKLLSRIRPDPNTLNDGLRIDAALSLMRRGRREDAKIFLAGVRTGIPILSRLRIAGYKAYAERAVIGFFFIGILIILLLVRAVPRLLAPPKKAPDEEEEHFGAEQDRSSRPFFVTARGRQGGLPHEYLDGLYELGLDGTATLREIKTAYRNKIKDIHPDHQGHTAKDADEFLRIKEVYEELLEIRKRMGIDD